MEALRYRGQAISVTEVEFIRQFVAAHPGASRRALSQKLCEAWGWRQANGALREGVCRGLLLRLDRAGEIARRLAIGRTSVRRVLKAGKAPRWRGTRTVSCINSR